MLSFSTGMHIRKAVNAAVCLTLGSFKSSFSCASTETLVLYGPAPKTRIFMLNCLISVLLKSYSNFFLLRFCTEYATYSCHQKYLFCQWNLNDIWVWALPQYCSLEMAESPAGKRVNKRCSGRRTVIQEPRLLQAPPSVVLCPCPCVDKKDKDKNMPFQSQAWDMLPHSHPSCRPVMHPWPCNVRSMCCRRAWVWLLGASLNSP